MGLDQLSKPQLGRHLLDWKEGVITFQVLRGESYCKIGTASKASSFYGKPKKVQQQPMRRKKYITSTRTLRKTKHTTWSAGKREWLRRDWFFKVIFNRAPKVIRDCIGFAIPFSLWLVQKTRATLRSTNQVQNERKHDSGARVFPRSRRSVCFYF